MHCNIKLDLAEKILRTLVQNLGTYEFFIAVSNAFCHGEVMLAAEESFDDGQLEKMHNHLDEIKKITEEIQ